MNKKEREELKEKILEDFKKSLEDKNTESVVEKFIATSVNDPGKENNRKEANL